MYQLHPSLNLQALFSAKPYEGARPEDATFVFIGLDANYAPDLEHTPVFEKILEYHSDGVAFWKHCQKHYPFLLSEYHGDGRTYLRNFAKIGFQAQDASRISFIELLHVPTCGRNRLDVPGLRCRTSWPVERSGRSW